MKLYTEFFVDEEKGVVVCKVEAVRRCGCIENIYVGKAKCQEGDVFDEITGRRIAETKAHLKMHKALQKQTMREFNATMKRATELKEKFFQGHEVVLGLVDKLNKLTGEK